MITGPATTAASPGRAGGAGPAGPLGAETAGAAGGMRAGRRWLARVRAAARARLVEVLDGRMELATYGAGPLALAELREGFRATDGPRRRWSPA